MRGFFFDFYFLSLSLPVVPEEEPELLRPVLLPGPLDESPCVPVALAPVVPVIPVDPRWDEVLLLPVDAVPNEEEVEPPEVDPPELLPELLSCEAASFCTLMLFCTC